MRLATILFFFALLTPPLASTPSEASSEPGSNIVRTSESAIEKLDRLHQLAESQIVGNDFDGAIRTYSDILLLEPDDETAYTGLGNCYLLLGQFKNANEAYRNALAINPENESAILGIQKIMDPDGLEGMVHPSQIESESHWPGMDPSKAMESLTSVSPPQPSRPLSVEKKAAPAPAVQPAIPSASKTKAPEKKPIAAQKKMTPPPVSAPAKISQPAPRAIRRPLPLSLLSRRSSMSRLGAQSVTIPPKPMTPPAAIKQKPAAKPKPTPIVLQSAPKKKTASKPAEAPKKITAIKAIPEPPKKPAAAQTGKDVMDPREIQKALRNTGFYSGPVDGVLGPVSRKAVKEFQSLHALAPDGVVGDKTWASLRLYLDSK